MIILTWDDLLDIKNINKSGVLPLIILKCFDIVYDNINILSDDDIDMILYNIKLAHYDKIVAKYNIPDNYSKNLKGEFKKLLDNTINNYGNKLIFKYRRFIEDAIMTNKNINRNSINILKFKNL